MDIKKEGLDIYNDKQIYYLKNPSENIIQVNKMIVMERFGFIWKPNTVKVEGDGKTGRWVKKLPAEEDFSISTEKDWTELENARLRGEGRPGLGEAPVVEEKKDAPKLGPDDTKTQRDEENKARLKAEADAKAAAEAKAKADADGKAKK